MQVEAIADVLAGIPVRVLLLWAKHLFVAARSLVFGIL
jgi:hypothetical protein